MRGFSFTAVLLFSALNSAQGAETDANSVLCERAGPDIVICDEVAYRKEKSGAMNTTGKALKLPHARRPAIIAPVEDAGDSSAPGAKPAQ